MRYAQNSKIIQGIRLHLGKIRDKYAVFAHDLEKSWANKRKKIGYCPFDALSRGKADMAGQYGGESHCIAQTMFLSDGAVALRQSLEKAKFVLIFGRDTPCYFDFADAYLSMAERAILLKQEVIKKLSLC